MDPFEAVQRIHRIGIVAGAILTPVLFVFAVIMIPILTVLINGYHEECGLRSAVPFACAPGKQTIKATKVGYDPTMGNVAPPGPPSPAIFKPTASSSAKSKAKPPSKPSMKMEMTSPWKCQPTRVQCRPGATCYYDLGYRGYCEGI